MGATISIPSYETPIDTEVIRGLPSTLVDLPPVAAVEGSDHDGPYSEIVVPDKFPPGSVMLFATQLQGVDPALDEFCKSSVDEAFKDLDLIDLNVLLFRCDGEERDATGESVFEVPLTLIHRCSR
jgi:glycogen debranching enzyme